MPIVECDKCGFKSNVPEEWKAFNTVLCPRCFNEIALPWCRKGFEPKGESLVIMDKEDFFDILSDKEKEEI